MEPMSLDPKDTSRLRSSITLTSTSSDSSLTSDDDAGADADVKKRRFEGKKKKVEMTKKKMDKSKSLTSLKIAGRFISTGSERQKCSKSCLGKSFRLFEQIFLAHNLVGTYVV